jgi:hypothetical protein
MPGRVRPCLVVPSEKFPTLESAVSASPHGAAIQILSGHDENLDILILDQPFEIEGPPDRSACLQVEHGIVCASQGRATDLVLRSLTLQSTHAPVLTIAGPCSVEFCRISSKGVGIQVTVGKGNDLPYIAQNTVSGCETALHLAGGCHAFLDRNCLEQNSIGIAIVGLELPEGSSNGLQALEKTQFIGSSKADLQLMSLSIRDAFDESLHTLDASSDINLQVFSRACTLQGRTEQGMLSLRIDRGHTFAALSAPFEYAAVGMLPRRGRWRTSPIRTDVAGMRERRRDFVRLVAPDSPPSFIVVAPGESPPTHWARQCVGELSARDVTASAADAAAADLIVWLTNALQGTDRSALSGLEDSCMALLSAGEGVSFAMTYGLTPVLTQPHFVLFVSPVGEVRIAWFVYVTDEVRPNAQSGRWLAVLLTEDLNSPQLVVGNGVWLRFAASATDEPEMAQILARNTAALRRAVDEDAWDLVLAAM